MKPIILGIATATIFNLIIFGPEIAAIGAIGTTALFGLSYGLCKLTGAIK